MDKKTKTILAQCREPILALRKAKLIYRNAAAAELLPETEEGDSAAGMLPDHILFYPGERFSATLVLRGEEYAADCRMQGGERIVTLSPLRPMQMPEYFSDGMSAQLLSTLSNLGLLLDRVGRSAAQTEDLQLREDLLPRLRAQYAALKRQLGNLNTAIQMREGVLWLNCTETDLVTLCDDLASSVTALSGPSCAALRCTATLPELRARVDRDMVERLLLNLLSNSLNHTPPSGEVRLGVERSGRNAVLSVEDNGEGIPPEIMQNVFSRYMTRADARHLDRASSAGLGLTVASGLARLHGGALVIESRPGEGTCARVMLPLDGKLRLELGGTEGLCPRGPDSILTELAGVLPPEVYSERFLD